MAKWLDPPLTFTSILLLVMTAIQLTTPLSPRRAAVLGLAETAIRLIYVGSFALELLLSTNRMGFLRRH